MRVTDLYKNKQNAHCGLYCRVLPGGRMMSRVCGSTSPNECLPE
jgi:hypothetical protein